MRTKFKQLNIDWNAEPNAPELNLEISGATIILTFLMNEQQYPQFEGSNGKLTFRNCWQCRLGSTNDEGWSIGQCRFGMGSPLENRAPAWGELYELKGDLRPNECPNDWKIIGAPSSLSRHFLFYFRDQTFECDAEDFSFEPYRLPVV